MKNFREFVKTNKTKLYSLARENTKYNENGDAVISREDSWFSEDIWENDYKELVASDDDWDNVTDLYYSYLKSIGAVW